MGQLIQFAGSDPTEAEYKPRNGHRLAAYNRFRKGKDTLQIAIEMGELERTILKWISIERSRRLGLREPYEAKS